VSSPDQHRCSYLGVHIAGGRIYLAKRLGAGLVDGDDLRRIDVSDYMDNADALLDLLNRFRTLIRGANICAVGLLHTRSYKNWSYSDAFRRASIQSALSVATRQEGRVYHLIRQEDAAKLYELPSRWKTSDLGAEVRLAIEPVTKYWADRSFAWSATEVLASREVVCDRVE